MSLVNGKIPARTICPFRGQCDIAKNDLCKHKGVNHSVAFSCAAARGFALMERDASPVPPPKFIKQGEHHWLDVYDSDGHFFQRVLLQWAPSAQRWCHSGNLGTGLYVETQNWKYVCHQPMPD